MLRTSALLIAFVAILAVPLAGCGRGGNDELIRRVAAAEAAAERAEKAQKLAESAAARASAPVMVDEAEEQESFDEPEEADFNPDAEVFDNTIVTRQPPPQTVVQSG
jgi:hypothetical protein